LDGNDIPIKTIRKAGVEETVSKSAKASQIESHTTITSTDNDYHNRSDYSPLIV
jgi:hypothetical protein